MFLFGSLSQMTFLLTLAGLSEVIVLGKDKSSGISCDTRAEVRTERRAGLLARLTPRARTHSRYREEPVKSANRRAERACRAFRRFTPLATVPKGSEPVVADKQPVHRPRTHSSSKIFTPQPVRAAPTRRFPKSGRASGGSWMGSTPGIRLGNSCLRHCPESCSWRKAIHSFLIPGEGHRLERGEARDWSGSSANGVSANCRSRLPHCSRRRESALFSRAGRGARLVRVSRKWS